MKELNNINSDEKVDNLNTSKSSKFTENTKSAIRRALATTGIVASSMLPVNTPTVVPASANTITRIEPLTSDAIEENSQGTAGELFTAFNEKSNETSEYRPMEINSISPSDILPIVGQIETGDKKVYEHIEHLRLAESTRIRDMMWEYGAGNHSAEEYKQLMNRLHTGMTLENPLGYDNYETIGGEVAGTPSVHAHDEWNILNTLVNHTNFVIANPQNGRLESLTDTVNNNPNNIYIIGNSAGAEGDKELYQNRKPENFKKLYKLNNYLEFIAGTNIKKKNGILKNKIYQEDIDGDESGIYAMPSTANGKNDSDVDRHLIVTIGTNKIGDIDQTNQTAESSKFPVGFHNDVLFAGRAFPYLSGAFHDICAEERKYATSYTNYVNVAMADLCFQMFAEVKDVDELLEMIRSSTDLRDYVRFDLNGDGDTDDIHDGQQENQELILMNPAGFFQKYLMPTNLPVSLKDDNIVPLEKGYYHGVVYQIPGAEVNINGEWIPFTDNNKDLIMAQNPMNLEWRLNGESLDSYGYKPGDTINGQILVVDDMWNGLNMTKDFSVGLEARDTTENSCVSGVNVPDVPEVWYSVDGHMLDVKPTKPGVYVVNGEKVIIK